MKYTQYESLLTTITKALVPITTAKCSYSDIFELSRDITDTIHEINLELFNSKYIVPFPMFHSNTASEFNAKLFVEDVEHWVSFIQCVIANRRKQNNSIDLSFCEIVDYIKYVSKDAIIKNTIACLLNHDADSLARLNYYYQRFSYFWGTLDTDKQIYDTIYERINILIDKSDDFIWLYDKLGDYRSKLVLVNFIKYWLTYDFSTISLMKENNYPDYFDMDLLHCDCSEVIVDAGAFIGDSVLDYINTFNHYKKIYCYEISPATFDELTTNLSAYPNIAFLNKGVGSTHKIMYLDNADSNSACNMLNSANGKEVEVVALDEDIHEKLTMIKMDIEGAEQDAIRGCQQHILNDKPKLLICVYHNNRDIIEIPRMIHDIRSDYKFYLRSNGCQIGLSEIVFYAL